MARTQGLVRLTKREFWTLFWSAYESSFTQENIRSRWKRTGLLPFEPEVVLSQITQKTEGYSDTGSDLAGSAALKQPSARELRRLVDKVVGDPSKLRDPDAQKLKDTVESLQTQIELLRNENQGLREAVFIEKKRRQRGKPLKDYLFDRVDPNSAQVFSPQKIAQARLRKAKIEAQKQEEILRKEAQKIERQQKAQEQKEQVLERKRQREEKKEKKRQEMEAKKQEKDLNRQLREDIKRQKQEKALERRQRRPTTSNPAGDGTGNRAKAAIALPSRPKSSATSQLPTPRLNIKKKGQETTPAPTNRFNRPSLAVESPREAVEAFRSSGRPQRNSRRPRWLDDCYID